MPFVGGGEVGSDGVQQGLDPLVPQRAPTEHGHPLTGEGQPPHRLLQLGGGTGGTRRWKKSLTNLGHI